MSETRNCSTCMPGGDISYCDSCNNHSKWQPAEPKWSKETIEEMASRMSRAILRRSCEHCFGDCYDIQCTCEEDDAEYEKHLSNICKIADEMKQEVSDEKE